MAVQTEQGSKPSEQFQQRTLDPGELEWQRAKQRSATPTNGTIHTDLEYFGKVKGDPKKAGASGR